MTLWLREMMDRFDLLSLRERALVLAAILGLLVVLWDSALMGPLDRESRARRAQIEALRAEVTGLETSVETLVAQGAADPQGQSRNQRAALKQQIAALDTQLASATSGLVAPQEMAHVLEQLLQRTSHLTLNALRALPPQPVVAEGAAAPAGTATGRPQATAQIYRHGIEIEVDGTYLEALDFLEAVEALPWRFFWDRVEYQVGQHPQGRLKLTLYTLGLKEGWIGV